MDSQAVTKWLKTAGIAAGGGGIAAALTAAMDPSKYHFPHDFGSGKLWIYFFQGAGLVFVGMLLKSPLGQQVMGAYKDSQQQLQASKDAVDSAKAELHAAAGKADAAASDLKSASQTLPKP